MNYLRYVKRTVTMTEVILLTRREFAVMQKPMLAFRQYIHTHVCNYFHINELLRQYVLIVISNNCRPLTQLKLRRAGYNFIM